MLPIKKQDVLFDAAKIYNSLVHNALKELCCYSEAAEPAQWQCTTCNKCAHLDLDIDRTMYPSFHVQSFATLRFSVAQRRHCYIVNHTGCDILKKNFAWEVSDEDSLCSYYMYGIYQTLLGTGTIKLLARFFVASMPIIANNDRVQALTRL